MKETLPFVTLTFLPAYFFFHADWLGLAASKKKIIFVILDPVQRLMGIVSEITAVI
jgi:hypothetical protein